MDCFHLFTCLLLKMNHARISMLLSRYIPAGRRNVARTGKDGTETNSHEDRRNLDPLRAHADYYYYYYYESETEVILNFDIPILHIDSPCVCVCVTA